MKLFLLSISVLFFIQCGNREPKPATKQRPVFLPIADKEELSPYGFFESVYSMTLHEQLIYLPDWEGSRIIVTDTDLNPIRQIGRPGEGPGELSHASYMTISGGRLFVKSGRNKRIVVFDLKGTFLTWIPISELFVTTRFAVYEETLFLSSPNLEKPLIAIDTDGQHLFPFGQFRDEHEPFRVRRAQNIQHLAIAEVGGRPMLIAVGLTEPNIECYDLDGRLISRLNLAKNPHLLPRLSKAAEIYKDSKKREMSVVLFSDISVQNDQLWAMVINDEPPHKVLRFQLSEGRVHFIDAAEIRQDIGAHTAAHDGLDKLYLFDDKTNGFRIFQLQNMSE